MPQPAPGPDDGSGDDAPEIPAEILEAIERLETGKTASKDDIEAVLKF